MPAQQAAFRALMPGFAASEQGRNFGLGPTTSYAAFRSQVPLRTYDQFAAPIERMKRGEKDVLWPGQCRLYAVTPGTSGQPAKWLPMTEPMLAHFRRAGLASLLWYTARTGHCGVFHGRHLLLGASSALTEIPGTKPFTAFAGEVSGIATLNLPGWALHHLFEPGAAVAQIPDGPEKLRAIVQRATRADVTLLAGLPSWLLGLADEVLHEAAPSGSAPANLQSVWPNLECIVHGGIPVGPYADQLRALAGRSVRFHEIYAASEGFIAAQDTDAGAGLRLIADAGLFFEFLPLADYVDAASLPGNRALPLEAVRAGEDYVLVATTPGGLCRYVLGDVVRFTSTEPPRLVHVGRTQLQLNAFGERVMEKHLTDTLVAVCERHGWSIVNFHVAPLAASSLTGQKHGRHEWWVELRPGTNTTPTGPLLSGELDRELMARSPDYAAKRRGACLESPLVRLVMPGFFDHWMRHHGTWGGQRKLPRCRSDRQLADDLAAIACFTD